MPPRLVSLLGGLLVLAAVCVLVASAAYVSTALALFVAGFFLLAAGVVTVWLAEIADEELKKKSVDADDASS
jgi:uncharacterized membrane protein HdeD (DUF308 family)